MRNEQVAQIAHEVNRAYCLSLGDTSQQNGLPIVQNIVKIICRLMVGMPCVVEKTFKV